MCPGVAQEDAKGSARAKRPRPEVTNPEIKKVREARRLARAALRVLGQCIVYCHTADSACCELETALCSPGDTAVTGCIDTPGTLIAEECLGQSLKRLALGKRPLGCLFLHACVYEGVVETSIT